MIAQSKIEEVQRMLAETDFSQRKIAKMTGVSRAVVGSVASGKRPDYEAIRKEKNDLYQPTGPLKRCKGCGGMVYDPCRLCKLRAVREYEQELVRFFRRQARKQALRKLLETVRESYLEREAAAGANGSGVKLGDGIH